MSMSLTCSS